MLDAILDWAIVILPTILSVVGVLVSLRAPHSKHHKALRASLIGFGVIVSAVTFWQQARSRTAHAGEVKGLNDKITTVAGTTASLTSETKRLRQEQQTEVARRQQAEHDLLTVVQGTGRSTRTGVVEDIKKSPIKVELSGSQQAEQPLRLTPQFIGVLPAYNSPPHINQGTFVILTNKIITPIRLLVTCDEEIDLASGGVSGTNAMMGGGWGGRVTRSNKQFGIGILSPAWAPTNPLLVTVYANQNPGRCSFEEQ